MNQSKHVAPMCNLQQVSLLVAYIIFFFFGVIGLSLSAQTCAFAPSHPKSFVKLLNKLVASIGGFCWQQVGWSQFGSTVGFWFVWF